MLLSGVLLMLCLDQCLQKFINKTLQGGKRLLFNSDPWPPAEQKLEMPCDNTLCRHYDKDKPQLPDKVSELQKSFGEVIKNYQETNTKLVCKLPRMSGYAPKIPEPEKYTPYYVAKEQKRVDGNLCMEDSLNEISVRISDVIKEGFNFLRVEASEIFAFVATDADRVVKPGIPPHIPIAYGLRGSSMSAEIMRNMINDL